MWAKNYTAFGTADARIVANGRNAAGNGRI
jgi:hypothetical protein